MANEQTGSPDSLDDELRLTAAAVTLETFAKAAGELTRLSLTKEPTRESVDAIAAQAALALIEQTRSRQPFDPYEIGLVVSGTVAACLEIYIGSLRTVMALERQRIGLV